MILLELKKYITEHRRASMWQISKFFNMDPDSLRPMLQLCVRKGQIRLCPKLGSCGSRCSRCSSLMTEIYEVTAAESAIPVGCSIESLKQTMA
ncbi:MAG: hypothetical protein A3F17_05275 [Gammaproteobacteria bacterium RIFCSPHIGHO2_12_FULL_41_15]|nr:MAG: hypothetical protein A3F17_05275 [Gammaproteobacteria bacterium RIFCSPHIGHO2_12_FULL_41_15]